MHELSSLVPPNIQQLILHPKMTQNFHGIKKLIGKHSLSKSMAPLIDKKCMLCIEPAGDICLLLEMMLHRNDISIQHVAKLAEAIIFLHNQQPALIIIENTFVENKMVTAISAIRESAPASKLLMISSVGGEVAGKAASAGIDAFLTKPSGKSALLDTALSMLQ